MRLPVIKGVIRRRILVNFLVDPEVKDLAQASGFFEPGSVGYSATTDQNRLDGLKLKTKTWRMEPLEVEEVFSSCFADEEKFPKGSICFDCALMMRNIEHEWQSEPDLYV